MDILSKILKRHQQKLLQLPNVVGVGKGIKTVRGDPTAKQAVVVLVKKKVPRKKLRSQEVVPLKLDEVHTDVIEVGEPRLLAGRTEYKRPAQPGMSIGHYLVTAGTFGAVVKDKKTGEPLILSNNHVLANSTNGKDGRASIGDPVLQPGPYDGGTKKHVIGYLERYIPLKRKIELPDCKVAAAAEGMGNQLLMTVRPNYRLQIQKVTSEENIVDAAVAKPVNKNAVSPNILEIGSVRGTIDPEIGLEVQKSGRSSGLNNTVIQVIEATLSITLTDEKQGLFTQQIITGPIAQPGDSGSLVLNKNNQAVGLLFAGSDKISVVNPIKNVMELLQIEF